MSGEATKIPRSERWAQLLLWGSIFGSAVGCVQGLVILLAFGLVEKTQPILTSVSTTPGALLWHAAWADEKYHENRITADSPIIAAGDRVRLHIPTGIKSLRGHWRHNGMHFFVERTPSQTQQGIPPELPIVQVETFDWGDEIVTRGKDPYGEVEIPVTIAIPDDSLLASQNLRGTIWADLEYPTYTTTEGLRPRFENVSSSFTREVAFSVFSPAAKEEWLRGWRRAKLLTVIPLLVYPVVLTLALLGDRCSRGKWSGGARVVLASLLLSAVLAAILVNSYLHRAVGSFLVLLMLLNCLVFSSTSAAKRPI